MKREIICPVCDAELVKVVPPTYPELNREFEGVRRRRGRARLPMRCDQCNVEIPLLGLCFAWSFYLGRGGDPTQHRGAQYFDWEATRIELPLASSLSLPAWTCTGCRSELGAEDAVAVLVKERVGPPAGVPGEVKEREIALPGSFHKWCAAAATAVFYDRQRHEHGFEGCRSCDFGRIKPCPLLEGSRP